MLPLIAPPGPHEGAQDSHVVDGPPHGDGEPQEEGDSQDDVPQDDDGPTCQPHQGPREAKSQEGEAAIAIAGAAAAGQRPPQSPPLPAGNSGGGCCNSGEARLPPAPASAVSAPAHAAPAVPLASLASVPTGMVGLRRALLDCMRAGGKGAEASCTVAACGCAAGSRVAPPATTGAGPTAAAAVGPARELPAEASVSSGSLAVGGAPATP
mmetsp:Transcript_71924/g.203113  ORF Transcript_71924/g.203113 Transcript_71924/m.203113 type:complete len:210 (-) Transcript_71924:1-630(-)